MTEMSDQDRVKHVYLDEQGEFRVWGKSNYNQLQAQVAYTETSFREQLYALLRTLGWDDPGLSTRQVLEIGCGWGRNFPLFLDMGIPQQNIHGIDLLQPFVDKAQQTYPTAHIHLGDAGRIQDFGKKFDMVLIHTTLSAILDAEVHQQIIKAASHCIAPQGVMVVMDIVENYQEGKIAVGAQHVTFIKSLSRHQIDSYCQEVGLICVLNNTFGLAPRWRNGVYARLGKFIQNPIGLRMMADMLSLVSKRRSHYIVAYRKGP